MLFYFVIEQDLSSEKQQNLLHARYLDPICLKCNSNELSYSSRMNGKIG